MKNLKYYTSFLMVLFFTIELTAQVVYNNEEKGQSLKLFHKVQMQGQFQQMDDDRIVDGDDRMDMFIRRGRFGASGTINPKIEFKVWYAYDNLGRDPYTNAINGMVGNNPGDKVFQVWDAYVKFKMNQKFNITVGHFRPQTSRESTRSAFGTMTFEKVFSNFIHRSYTVNAGYGRSTGIDFGGTFPFEKAGIQYNLGVFNAFESTDKTVKIATYSPMFAGRLSFYTGTKEKGKKDNHFGKRKGIIVGVYGTHQAKVDQSRIGAISVSAENGAIPLLNDVTIGSLGADFLANYGGFNFKAEYSAAKIQDLMGASTSETGDYGIETYDAIAGYTINNVGTGDLEFAVGYSVINADEKLTLGDVSVIDKKYAANYGDIDLLDIGLNYYIKEDKYKINLHYVMVGEDAGKEVDNDYIALGLQLQW